MVIRANTTYDERIINHYEGRLMGEKLGPRKLGPLTPLVGHWEGDGGIDLSYHNKDDETTETTYFEKAWFRPIPVVENGQQTMQGLNYAMTAWRHGEEAMDPFHDEVGYLLWDQAHGQVIRCFAVPRGLAILAGGDATARDTSLTFKAEPGSGGYGLCQNKYLLERATCTAFESTFTFNANGTLSYTSDLALKLKATNDVMHHTDRNTLHRTRRIHPSDETP
ncbi:MAG: heme-binding beta-barrel domain-containing protein [Acetobacteraceae bacterium]